MLDMIRQFAEQLNHDDIRKLKREGESVASIARTVGVSRDTVYKYVEADDLSPEMPVQKRRASKLDPYRPLIEQWLDEDAENWRKQRHTAHKVWERLTTEEGVKVSEARVRAYVRMIREERKVISRALRFKLSATSAAEGNIGFLPETLMLM
ncbi:MAG TPA: hypothetical protein DCP91_02690 [Eggerthellaceae bacterium]|nr:hypothetical protein [Eggerthellaceae bacterium]